MALNYGSRQEIINALKNKKKKKLLMKKILKKIYIQIIFLIQKY